MKFKSFIVMGIIIISLIPAWMIYNWLKKRLQPDRSMRKFILYLLAVLSLVFIYTFLVVFAIKMLFPDA